MKVILALPFAARVAALGEGLHAAETGDQIECLSRPLLEIATQGRRAVEAPKGRLPWSWFSGQRKRTQRSEAEMDAAAYLLSAWPRLSSEVRREVGQFEGTWLVKVLERAQSWGHSSRAMGLARAVGELRRLDVCGGIGGLLMDAHGAVRDATEGSLFGTLAEVMQRGDEARTDGDVRHLDGVARMLVTAVERRCAQVDGGQVRGLLMCGLLLAEPVLLRRAEMLEGTHGLNALLGVMLDEDSPCRNVARSVLRWSKCPAAAARSVEWLAIHGLSRVCAERLTAAAGVYEHAAILGRWHLLLRPNRARLLAGITPNMRTLPPRATAAALPAPRTLTPTTQSIWPMSGEYEHLTAPERRGIGALAQGVKAGAPRRAPLLQPLLTDRCPLVRLSAMLASPNAAVADWCFDAHPAIARSAALRFLDGMRDSDESSGRVIQGLARSEVTEVAAWAKRAIPIGAVAWEASRSRRTDPSNWAASTRQSLRGGSEPLAILQTLAEVRASRAASDFIPELIRLAVGAGVGVGDPRVQATALSLLGGSSDPAAAAAVRVGLKSENERVISNAVDACVGQGRRGVEPGSLAMKSVMELKDHPHHRVRGSALRAQWMLTKDGRVGEIIEMLRDPRPAHRLAGAWLAGRVAGLQRETPRACTSAQHREIAHELNHLSRGAGDESADMNDVANRIQARAASSLARWHAVGISVPEVKHELRLTGDVSTQVARMEAA